MSVKEFLKKVGPVFLAVVLVMLVCNSLIYAVAVEMTNRELQTIEAKSLAASLAVRP
ncbi:MAG: hypothetical protein AB9919_02150 [Geobacteraceae bacterium]